MSGYKDNSRDWLYFAESDLKTARVVMEEEKIYHMVCFHAQQTVEKSLKAVLRRFDVRVPKTHSLSKLALEIGKLGGGPKIDMGEMAFMDQFYVPSRYPDAFPGSLPEGLPDIGECKKGFGNSREGV
jgi:HEPN domain-containing protein